MELVTSTALTCLQGILPDQLQMHPNDGQAGTQLGRTINENKPVVPNINLMGTQSIITETGSSHEESILPILSMMLEETTLVSHEMMLLMQHTSKDWNVSVLKRIVDRLKRKHWQSLQMLASIQLQQELMDKSHHFHNDNCHIRQLWDFHTVQLEAKQNHLSKYSVQIRR